MKRKLILGCTLAAVLALGLFARHSVHANVLVSAPDKAVPLSADYKVTLSAGGKNYALPLQDLLIPPLTEKDKRDVNQRRPLAGVFEFGGAVDVKVEMPAGKILQSVVVRPLSKKIAAKKNGNSFSFRLSSPQNLSVEINGDARPIFLFANPIYAAPLSTHKGVRTVNSQPADKGVLSLQGTTGQTLVVNPGAFVVGDINLDDTTDATVYLGLGSVVCGKIFANRAKNVRVFGSGVLWSNGATAGNRFWSHTVEKLSLEGPLFVQNEDNWTTYLNNTNNAHVKNLKIMSAVRDGIDFNGCRDGTAEDCFVYAFDDGIAVMSNNWSSIDARSVHNIVVKNSSVWNTGGGNPIIVYPPWTKAPVIENVIFQNIDILHKENDSNKDLPTGAIGGFSYWDTQGVVRNVVFRDIRIERYEIKTPSDYLFDFVLWEPDVKYHNFRLENILFLDEVLPPSIVRTGDAPGEIDGVAIVNFRHRDKLISNDKDAKLEHWGQAHNIRFGDGASSVVLNRR